MLKLIRARSYVTETPAQITTVQRIAAENLALKAVASLKGAGMFGVEMFLLPDNRVLLNEVAPRVHNSGHYTINGCVTSQFENHVRAVMGYELGDTSLTSPHVIMLNILGADSGENGLRIAEDLMRRAYSAEGCSVHWYDKDGVKKDRKIGHINIVGKTIEEARKRLEMLDLAAAARLTPLQTVKSTAKSPELFNQFREYGNGLPVDQAKNDPLRKKFEFFNQ